MIKATHHSKIKLKRAQGFIVVVFLDFCKGYIGYCRISEGYVCLPLST